jgi:biopolymer transport protein ExbD
MKVHLGSHKKKRLITEINMVPFIDVVLVLLDHFHDPFAVHRPIPNPGEPAPAAGTPSDDDTPAQGKNHPKDGDYYVGDQRVLRNNLAEKLSRHASQKPAARRSD